MCFDTISNGLFMKDISTSNREYHNNSDSNGNDNHHSDVSFRNMKQRKEHLCRGVNAKDREIIKLNTLLNKLKILWL